MAGRDNCGMDVYRSVRTMTGLALIVGTLTLPSCSTDVTDASPADAESSASAAATSEGTPDSAIPGASASGPATQQPAGVPVPAGLVGAGCAGYAVKVPTGPGSLDGMSTDPVAVALSNSPQLTTLSSALSGKLNSEVNVADALNKGQFTVFAPIDDAWGRLNPETVSKWRSDSAQLTAVLNYHLVSGQLPPDQVAGEHKTVQGGVINVTGSGGDLRVNDAAVVCGGIRTSNATVYLIDAVLMPPPPPPPPSPGATTPGSSSETTTTSTSSSAPTS